MFLDYFALGVLVFVVLFLFYGIIAIHDIPYEIAHKRNHPHCDAIHVAGWVSLFTLHVLWPFLWIWATLWREDRGWGFNKIENNQLELQARVNHLNDQVELLSEKLARMEGRPSHHHSTAATQRDTNIESESSQPSDKEQN